eukprot:778672-Rhodomonas_salina.2
MRAVLGPAKAQTRNLGPGADSRQGYRLRGCDVGAWTAMLLLKAGGTSGGSSWTTRSRQTQALPIPCFERAHRGKGPAAPHLRDPPHDNSQGSAPDHDH